MQARINPRTESPIVATIITGTIIGVLAFFVPLEILADLVSMGRWLQNPCSCRKTLSQCVCMITMRCRNFSRAE